MKKVILHIKRLFRKFWFGIFFCFAISPIFGFGMIVLATIISLTLFETPKEEKNPTDYFTEEELRKILSDEYMNEEEYLNLTAKYQTYECPRKIDEITTWTSSEVTEKSFICNYEINDKRHKYGEIDMDVLKKTILNQLDKEDYKIQCIVATNRDLTFRYWNCQTETLDDIVITNEELKS